MKPVKPPLRPATRGERVVNLQNALLHLIEKKVIQLPPAPSPSDPVTLITDLRHDRDIGIYKGGTANPIILFREQYKERFHLTPGGDVDVPTADALNKLLQEVGAFQAEPVRWVIRGHLTDVNKKDLSGHVLLLSEYDVNGTTQIGRAVTKVDGAFEFIFDFKEILQSGDGDTAPDLVFHVLDATGAARAISSIFTLQDAQEIPVPRLAESDGAPIVLMNVPPELNLRVEVALNQKALTEFEQLIERLKPFMRKVSFADLKEDETNFQISFLTRESGVEKEKIVQVRDAFQHADRSGRVPAWAFFALSAEPIDIDSVRFTTLERLVSVLKPGQPSNDKQKLEVIAKNLQEYAGEQNVRSKTAALKTSLATLLQPILGSEDKLNAFLEAYARHKGEIESFWKEVSKKSSFKEDVPKIQLNLQLTQLTLGNQGLITALQRKGIENTRQLVDISSEDWEAMVLDTKSGIPAHISGKNDRVRAKVYAQELQTLVERAFPTDVIKRNLKQPEVSAFLRQNPEFDFTRTPVDTFLHRREDKLIGKKENGEELKTQLRKIQRTYAVTRNANDTNHLMEMKFESAHQIAQLTRADFARRVAGKISEDTAFQYHQNAVAISSEVAIVHQMLRDYRSEGSAAVKGFGPEKKLLAPLPNGVPDGTAAGKGSDSNDELFDDRIPDWRNLFDSLDTCECEHCKSVYSPAAYFVDLLHILLGQRDGAPRIELFSRRPDLKYTKLTCEHTETLIPYIDLVNEVLQTYVANNDVGNSNADVHASKATNDTSKLSASDLAANPQYPNEDSEKDATKAYDLLRDNAIYPLNLPFDMRLEIGRQFLEEQKSSRFEVMHMLGTPTSFATAAEGLKISKREFEILTLKQLDGTTDPNDIKAIKDHLWGDPAPAGNALGRVDIFIAAAGIDYIDLISLLKTRFLNKNFPINVHIQELSVAEGTAWTAAHPNENKLALSVVELVATDKERPCDLSKTLIQHIDGKVLTKDELSLFNRFIRLWKKLGCTIPELDALLVALGASDITPKVIKDLSGLWRINQRLELPLERLAVLAGPIQTAGKDSLFERLFLNKAILQIDDKFRLNVPQAELDDTKELLKKHVPAILAAMQITEEDFNHIVAFVKINLATASLNVANLSTLYRYVVFAEGLKIKVKDLFIWLSLISASAWASVADLVKIQEFLVKLINYGFSAADFAYIFKNASSLGSSLPPAEDIINQSAKTLREGLLKIRQENTPKNDQVTADFLKTKLGMILEGEEATRIIGILDETNTQDKFAYLLTPRVSQNYKNILANYLNTADVKSIEIKNDVPERLKMYWSKIEPKLVPLLRRTFIQQNIIATFKSDAAFVALILQDAVILQTCLDMEADTPAHALAYNKLYILLYKSLWLINQLKLSAKELAFFQKNPSFANFDWKAFNFPAWLRVADFVLLRDKLVPAENDLISIFQTAKKSGDIAKAIVAVTDWDEVNVVYFVSKHTSTDFQNEILLVLLQQQMELSERIGVSIQKLHDWATDTVDEDQAQDIKRTLKAKYDEQGWIEISTKIYNRLRSLLRNALVAYLLQKQEIRSLGIRDAYDLYGYFLIDVEMDSCMLTSRLKQAAASVQLFVQRCLLNIESLKPKASDKIFPADIDASQWKWMKNYRVWEANRKVFLYPENWIEPELRDNKSPFFKELESELLQAEITNETAEKALMRYLAKLHDVSRLDICGIYEDTEGQELHVFGRTFNSPPQYFYRKIDLKTQVWTAWESVQVDIQGTEEGDLAGVHLIPVIWNRRLYLFWPIFTEKSDQEKNKAEKSAHEKWQEQHNAWVKTVQGINDTRVAQEKELAKIQSENKGTQERINMFEELELHSAESWQLQINEEKAKLKPEPTVDIVAAPPEPKEADFAGPSSWGYHEVRLAWSEYRQNKWTNKKVSQSFIKTFSTDGALSTHYFRFSLVRDTELKFKLFTQPFGPLILPSGEFQLRCNGKVHSTRVVSPSSLLEVIKPKQMNFYQSFLSAFFGFHEENSIPLQLQSYGTNDEILWGSEKEYQVLFPANHNFSNNILSRFIYQDHKRAYYVEPLDRFLGLIFLLQEPSKASPDIYDEILPFDLVDKDGPEPFSKSIRLDGPLTHSLDQLVDSGQIAAPTAMQIRWQQGLALSDGRENDSMDNLFARSLGGAPAPAANAEKQATVKIAGASLSGTESSPSRAGTMKSDKPAPSLVKPKLRFNPLFHAYTCELMGALDKNGIEGLLTISNQQSSDLIISGSISKSNFYVKYDPTLNVERPLPLEIIDFSTSGAYSLYNWELFFHAPFLIANRLSKNQRFEDAMRWYHFIFNPTSHNGGPTPARYWQVLPFRNTLRETLHELLDRLRLAANDSRRIEVEQAIAQWREHPFEPHRIARGRLIAYQKNVVMKYLDNLIAWGDQLFRQDTIESINEATQLYVLAALLLGKRVEKIPERGTIQAQNYDELEKKGLNSFSNALVELETIFPYYNLSANSSNNDNATAILSTTSPSWYFCLPENDKLLGYWDTVADRLFKIRHCQNIEGVERQLALFEPPIDPAILVRAVAGGVDINSVLSDLNSPRPYYRFSYIMQKALEICSDLKSVGNSMLSALEKKDGEALSMMRGQHETLLMSLTKSVRKLQAAESQRVREGLENTRAVTEHRADFYAKLLSEGLNASEKEHQSLSTASMLLSVTGQYLEMAASLANGIPDTKAGTIATPTGGGATASTTLSSGDKAAKALSAFGRYFNMLSTMTSFAANTAQTNAGYQRRAADWKFQQDLAIKEKKQIDKQILAAEIREQIADKEMSNHEQQFENAKEVEEFLRNKYTQEELYGWVIGELSTVYFQCYQLAYDLAKKAERTYRYELGLSDSNFVQFGIWDSFRKGLMSGEKLYLSLKQMEKSYMDQNRREYEITKHVSLLEQKPLALITLKETGTCILELPEALFDVDYPGHYMRRIKSVSLSIPCVVGPYTTVNCTLTLLSSKVRVNNIVPNAKDYAEDMETENARVISNYAATESIATSSGQNDSGIFELNFRDERYLPFEGAGAVSLWRIEFPKDFHQFDYDTISDVVLHLKYTAKEGGGNLKGAALQSLKKILNNEAAKPQARLFSLRHEFPTEWHRLQNVSDASGDHIQAFSIAKNRFPFVFQGGKININTVELFGVPNDRSNNLPSKLKLSLSGPDGKAFALKQSTTGVGVLAHHTGKVDLEVKNIGPAEKKADWTIRVQKVDVSGTLGQLEDILLLCNYTVKVA